jgi:hypothetical protein
MGNHLQDWVNNSDYVKDKASYIAIHLIPTDETLWTEDNFLRFSEERAKLILRKLGSYAN